MLRIGVSVILLLAACAAEAQQRRGINDDRRCVTPCTRAGGRPCRPCKPLYGWSSTLGQNDWQLFRLENEAYLQEINALAAKDGAYRNSPDYEMDLKAFSVGVEEQKAYLTAIRRWRTDSRF
jgi:hypothetical protein